MTTILIDASIAGLPGASERLAHLVDAGHTLAVVAAADRPGTAFDSLLPGNEVLRAMPAELPRGSWFVTADPATCGDHRPDVRTVLVGPRSDERRPTRCDVTARDLREAVLEILAADAMR